MHHSFQVRGGNNSSEEYSSYVQSDQTSILLNQNDKVSTLSP